MLMVLRRKIVMDFCLQQVSQRKAIQHSNRDFDHVKIYKQTNNQKRFNFNSHSIIINQVNKQIVKQERMQKIFSSKPQQLKSNNFGRTLIIEHMQPFLFEWCLAEYKQMKNYLEGYDVRLVISNSKSFLEYQGKEKEENQKHVDELIEHFGKTYKKGKYILVAESVVELCEKLPEPVCMLDMRGQKELQPNENWSTLIFGGILGDHPPRDRPEPVRKHFNDIRHLGELQLATDTAVLITRLILDNKIPLNEIPLIKQPTIKGLNINGQKTSVQMEGFSYVSKELDIQTGKMRQNLSKKQKKDIYMSEKVKQLLLRDDLDQQMIM